MSVYATEAVIVGIPQVLVRKLVLGGRYVNKVVGAVPVIVVLGLLVAVPPEIFAVAPATADPSSCQTVVKVNAVAPALSATVVRINSGV